MPAINCRGTEYTPLVESLPFLRPIYTEVELTYNVCTVKSYLDTNWWIPVSSLVLYGLLLTVGPKIMSKMDPPSLKLPLIFWNGCLSIFSIMGAIRTVPHLLHNLASKSFTETICTPPENDWGDAATGLWVQLFVLSKLPELIDTLFVVASKKPVLFLHWWVCHQQLVTKCCLSARCHQSIPS